MYCFNSFFRLKSFSAFAVLIIAIKTWTANVEPWELLFHSLCLHFATFSPSCFDYESSHDSKTRQND